MIRAVLVMIVLAQLVHAQDDDARALELHQLGAEALRDARFARARDLFREAMELSPNGGSAYNLALALRGTGESTEAIAVFERILSGELGEVSPTRAEDIRRWIIEERGALSTLELAIDGALGARLSLDGRELGTVTRDTPLRVQIDAGRRTILARADGFEPLEQTLFAERAAEQRIELHMRTLPARGLFEEPAFWITAGSVLLVAIGVSLIAGFAPYQSPPESYTPFGVAYALTSN
jgi:hypothetical protein